MNYAEGRLAEAAACEEQAKLLSEKAATIRQEIKDSCQHPYKHLTFTNGAVTSFRPDRDEYTMNVKCSLCNANYTNKFVVYRT